MGAAQPLTVSPQLKKRVAQTEKAAGHAAAAVTRAVDGLAWVGGKAASGGECASLVCAHGVAGLCRLLLPLGVQCCGRWGPASR